MTDHIAMNQTILTTVIVLAAVLPSLLILTLLAAWAMSRSEETILVGRHTLSRRDCEVFAGQLLAIDSDTGEVLGADHDYAPLDVEMINRCPERSYDIVRVPKKGDAT